MTDKDYSAILAINTNMVITYVYQKHTAIYNHKRTLSNGTKYGFCYKSWKHLS